MTYINAEVAPAGALDIHVIRKQPTEYTWRDVVKHGLPQRGLSKEINRWRWKNLPNLWRGVWRVAASRILRISAAYGTLYLTVIKADGRIIEYGLASMRVVTTAGVNYIVDAFQNSVELEDMRYHGIGTDNTAENVANTALGAEITTQYTSDNTRPTGTLTEGASANIYRTVGSITVDGSVACVEHGIFNQASNAGGTLLDRSVFSVVNLASADTLQPTYDFTIAAGN